MANIVAIYSIRTNRCRRIIRNDLPVSTIIINHPARIGEGIIEVPSEIEFSVAAVQEYLNTTNGKIPINDRYVAIINNKVIRVFIGDIDCNDFVPGASLIVSAVAYVGWRHLNDDRLVPSKDELIKRIQGLEDKKSVFRTTTRPQKTAQQIIDEDIRINVLITSLQKDLDAI